MSRRRGALVVAAFLGACLLLPSEASPAARSVGSAAGRGPAATIRAVPRPSAAWPGQVFTVVIKARRLRGAGSVAFHLVYDPEMVQPVPGGFSEGPLLRRGGAATSFLAAPATTGDRVMVGIARLGLSEGARGGGVLCRLAFRALRTGTATFAFDRARLLSPSAEAAEAGFVPATIEILPGRTGRKR